MSDDDFDLPVPEADADAASENGETAEQTGLLMTIAVLVISLFGFLGKIAGYAKEILIAKYWGASSAVDTFKVVYNSVVFLVYSKVEKLLRPTYLPLFVKQRSQGGDREAWHFLSVSSTLVFLVLALISAASMLAAPSLIRLGWPELAAANLTLAVDLLRISALAMLLLVMSVMCELTLHAYKRFTAPALADALRQVVLVGTIGALIGYAIYPSGSPEGIRAAAWGVLLGGATRLLVQLPALWRRLGLVRPSLDLGNPDLRRMISLMPPVVVGLLASTARTYFDSRFGTDAGEGVYAALDYGRKISDMPVMVLPFAVSLVVYPWVSEWATRRDAQKLADSLVSMTRVMAFIFVPLAVGMMVLATPIVQTVYERGQFTYDDTLLVRRALIPYSAGLPFLSVEASINHWYFALSDTSTPNYVGAAMAGLHVLIAYIGVYHLGLTVGILAAALSATKGLKVIILYAMLRKRIGRVDRRAITTFVLRLLVATAVMVVATVAISGAFADMLVGARTMQRLVFLAICGAGGGAAYLVAAALLRIEELTMVVGFARTKIAGKLRGRK